MEDLFNIQEFLYLVIISYILMTLMCDSGVILYVEIRCWSLLGVKGLNCDLLHPFFLQASQQLIKNCIRERIIRQGAFYFLENGGIYIYS